MEYCGYDYVKLDKSDGLDKLRYAVVSAVNQNMPVLLSLDNANDNWNIITGYENNGAIIYGFDGYSSYWKDIGSDMNVTKDGYLKNNMYFLDNWFEAVDFVLVVVGKTKPKVNNIDAFKQLIAIIKEENAIYEKNIISIQDERAVNMSEQELEILFSDCMGVVYQQMDTRHKLDCTFKESLAPNMPEAGDIIIKAAETLGGVGTLGFDAFSVLGEGWSVFMKPADFMGEFRKLENRLKMAEMLRKIVDKNLEVCDRIEDIINKLSV
jgi:hypothetical protein